MHEAGCFFKSEVVNEADDTWHLKCVKRWIFLSFLSHVPPLHLPSSPIFSHFFRDSRGLSLCLFSFWLIADGPIRHSALHAVSFLRAMVACFLEQDLEFPWNNFHGHCLTEGRCSAEAATACPNALGT